MSHNEPLLGREPLDETENGEVRGHDNSGSSPDAPSNKGQERRVIVNLLSATTGTSTISVPLMALTLGLLPAAVVMLVQSLLGVFANHVLSKESAAEVHRRHGNSNSNRNRDDNGDGQSMSYQELMRRRVSPRSGRAAALAVIGNGAGKLVVWLVILTDVILGSPSDFTGLLPDIMRRRGMKVHEFSWYMSRPVWAALLALVSLPAVSTKNLDKISWISSAGDVAVTAMAVGGVALAATAVARGEAYRVALWPSPASLDMSSGPRFWLQVAAAMPVLISTVLNQHSVLSISRQLHPYSQKAMDRACLTAALGIVALKIAIGASSLVLFGTSTRADVLLNYTTKSLKPVFAGRSGAGAAAATAMKLAFLVNGLLSFPLYLWPLQSNLWALLRGEDYASDRMANSRSFALTNYAVVAACAAIAAVTPDVQLPLALLGATVVGYLAFVGPALLVFKEGYGAAARGTAVAMLALGAFQFVVGAAGPIFK